MLSSEEHLMMSGLRPPPRLALLVLAPLILVACQAADSTPPTLVGSTPVNGAVDVSATQALMLNFSEAMDKGALVVSSSPAVDLEEAEWLDADSVRVRPVTTWAYATQHLVTIAAKDAAGNELATGTSIGFTVEAQPDTTAPATPVGLAATPTDGGFALSWTANSESDLQGYFVYYGEDAAVPTGAGYVTAPAHSLDVTGLENGATYHYVVTAEDEAGNTSAPTEPGSVVPLDDVPPTLVSSTPADGGAELGAVPLVRLDFSEAIDTGGFSLTYCEKDSLDAATCDSAEVALVSPTWSQGDSVVSYAANDVFDGGSFYAVFPSGADLAGNDLASDLSISFGLAVVPDDTPPTVTAFSTAVDTVDDVRRLVRITFSEEMDWSTLPAALLSSPPLGCSWTYSGTMATCRTGRLKEFTDYGITVAVTARDLAGNPLAAAYGAPPLAVGNLRPYLVSATPNSITAVSATVPIVLTFSERIAIGSIQGLMQVTVSGTQKAYGETFEEDGVRWIYAPVSSWGDGVGVSWSLPSVQDFNGNNSATSFNGSFVTKPVLGGGVGGDVGGVGAAVGSGTSASSTQGAPDADR